MAHITISLTQNGDLITAISKSLEIAKTLKETMYLKIDCGESIAIKPTSEVQDIITIAMQTVQIHDLKKVKSAV